MKQPFPTSCALAALAAWLLPLPAAARDGDAPRLPETVSVPLPKGQSIQFSLIPVSGDENLFSSFEFSIGESADADFPVKALPATVSGTVFSNGAWVLPMGCTEVTRAQYAAIMSPDTMPPGAEAGLPQTGVTRLEVQQFIERLNIWLQSDAEAKAALAKVGNPKRHGTPFASLPGEAEWEFAARGGTCVSQAKFADDIPYADEEELARFENVASQKGGRLKHAASTQKCNPCGLYDMFGNAEEMVEGPFRAEYAFGRTGAAVVRGASFLTQPEDATSFRRREVPLFEEKHPDRPYAKDSLGFRLCMRSAIYTNAVIGRLDEEWREHDAKRIIINPNDSTADSTIEKIDKDKIRMAEQIKALEAQIDAGRANEEISKENIRMAEQIKALEAQLAAGRESEKQALARIESLKRQKDEMQELAAAAARKAATADSTNEKASGENIRMAGQIKALEAQLAAERESEKQALAMIESLKRQKDEMQELAAAADRRATAADFANDEINREKSRLAERQANERRIQSQLESLKRQMDEMQKKVDAADQKVADAGASYIYNISYEAFRASVAHVAYTQALEDADDSGDANARKLLRNIETEKAEFITACEMLMTVRPEIMAAALQAKRKDIVAKLGSTSAQVPLFDITIASCGKIRKNGTVSSKLVNEWADAIYSLAQKTNQ